MSSIPSIYGSGDDEEEIFRLIDPDQHPDTPDDHQAQQEQERLASADYDEVQDRLDESVSLPSDLVSSLQELSDDQLAEVARLIEELQD